MSTRCYPLYQKGAPQLRVFLPNFWMKLIKPITGSPPNNVMFACSMEMTIFDIANYLDKIYGVKAIDVRTRIAMGATRKDPGKGYIVKDDDVKYAYVILPKEEKFVFPNIFPKEKDDELKNEEKSLDEAKKGYSKYLDKTDVRPGLPGWFGV